MAQHLVPIKTYLQVFAALMVLLVVTVAVAYVDLGRLSLPIAMLIAVAKAMMVVLVFMHVKFSSRLTQLIVVSAFFWLGILLVLTFSDYISRDWLPIASGWTEPTALNPIRRPAG
jgi:cytochrome c oxidase subunit IV